MSTPRQEALLYVFKDCWTRMREGQQREYDLPGHLHGDSEDFSHTSEKGRIFNFQTRAEGPRQTLHITRVA